jgi:hypothetical protein
MSLRPRLPYPNSAGRQGFHPVLPRIENEFLRYRVLRLDLRYRVLAQNQFASHQNSLRFVGTQNIIQLRLNLSSAGLETNLPQVSRII